VVAVPAGRAVEIDYPPATRELHHEVELVVAIGRTAKDVAPAAAAASIFGYAVGLDLTRRDLQAQMKAQSRPWEIGKAFDQSAPVGTLRRAADAGTLTEAAIRLEVDGQLRQQGRLDQMIWSVDEIIANLSTLFTLQPGDLIFTGTPEGVGPVERGQTLVGRIDGLEPLQVRLR
jgi:fumarylpyruvate hydrolase